MLIKKINLKDLKKIGNYLKQNEKYALIFIEKDMQYKIESMSNEIKMINKNKINNIFILEKEEIEENCKNKQILNPNEIQYPSYYIFELNKEMPIYFKVNIYSNKNNNKEKKVII